MIGIIFGVVAGIIATTSVASAAVGKNLIKITVDFICNAAKELLNRIKTFFKNEKDLDEKDLDGSYFEVFNEAAKGKTPRSRDDITKKAKTNDFEDLMVYSRDNVASTCSKCVYLRVKDKNGDPIQGIDDIPIFGDEIDEEIVSGMIITV